VESPPLSTTLLFRKKLKPNTVKKERPTSMVMRKAKASSKNTVKRLPTVMELSLASVMLPKTQRPTPKETPIKELRRNEN